MNAPARPPYGAPLNLDQAKRVAAAAEAEARKHGLRVAIAIVEPTGALVYFLKLDDTQYGSIDMAIKKAECAARYRRGTQAFAEQIGEGDIANLTVPGVVGYDGGELIISGGRVVGAIGVSGVTAEEDGVIARAGAGALS